MQTTECDDKPDLLVDISPNGDVVLIVGPQSVRMRVHSRCLSSASKVFGAMFSSRWREGQDLSEEFPKEVQLDEDDAGALHTICCVVHHRNNDLPQVITPLEVLQIAIAADKYDLSVALRFASAQWLQSKGDLDKTEMGCLLAAAFLFGDTEMFEAHSLALILNYEGSYMEFIADQTLSQALPYEAVCAY